MPDAAAEALAAAFWFCVGAMLLLAERLGMRFEAVLLLVFGVLHPALTLSLWLRLRRARRRLAALEGAGAGAPAALAGEPAKRGAL
jgi:hypothetical protein